MLAARIVVLGVKTYFRAIETTLDHRFYGPKKLWVILREYVRSHFVGGQKSYSRVPGIGINDNSHNHRISNFFYRFQSNPA